MTTLAALLLTAVALSLMVHPLLAGRLPLRARSEADEAREWEERYRSALADLQDAELDLELGNLSEADYRVAYDQHRRRAAMALQELDTRDAQRARVRAEIEREAARIAARAPILPPLPAATPARVARAPGKPRSQVPAGRALPHLPLLIGGAVGAVALVGIGAVYFHGQSIQAAQAPISTLTSEHAYGVLIDDMGQYWVANQGGLLHSVDGHKWESTTATGDIVALTYTPDHAQLLALGHHVLLSSPDSGVSWQPLTTDLPSTDIDGAESGSVGIYAYVAGSGVYFSVDGAHWEQTGTSVPGQVSALAVISEGNDADVLFVAVGDTVRRSADGGRTWSAAAGAANLALQGSASSVFADSGRSAVYAATSAGLFRSTTDGADWVKLPFRGSLTAVGARGSRLAVVDVNHNFYLSSDDGGSWLASS